MNGGFKELRNNSSAFELAVCPFVVVDGSIV